MRLQDSFSVGVAVTKTLSNFKMKSSKFVNERIIYVLTCIRETVTKLTQEVPAKLRFISEALGKQEL